MKHEESTNQLKTSQGNIESVHKKPILNEERSEEEGKKFKLKR